MHNVDFCWYTCFWIHKYIQVQNCGPWGVPCSHCFCNSVKSTWWEWKIMCWGRVGDYEYLAKYSGKFQKYFSIQVNKRIHPPNFQAFATSLIDSITVPVSPCYKAENLQLIPNLKNKLLPVLHKHIH